MPQGVTVNPPFIEDGRPRIEIRSRLGARLAEASEPKVLMPAIDLQALTAPVEPEDPCGPDLDLAGDVDYLNFFAGAEGMLPSSYFDGEGRVGRRRTPVPGQQDRTGCHDGGSGAASREHTRPAVARLACQVQHPGPRICEASGLHRARSRALLDEQWDGVHPRAEDGDFQARHGGGRVDRCQPTVIMPLQFLPLIEHRRFGTVSLP